MTEGNNKNEQAHSFSEQIRNKETSQRERSKMAAAYQAKTKDSEGIPLPKVDMNTLILSLSSSILVNLGEVPDPESNQLNENLDLARHTIDVLAMLEEKTKGNLTKDEEDLLKNVLFELRMKYVQKV